MNRIGLVCPVASGHLNPMTTLGRALKRRGHRVSLFAFPDGAYKARSAGLGFHPIGENDLPEGTVPRQMEVQGGLAGREALAFAVERYRFYSQVLLRDAPDVIKKSGVEGLLVDEGFPAAFAVAETLQLPWVTVSNAVAFLEESAMPPFTTSFPYDPTPGGRARNQQVYSAMEQLTNPIRLLINLYREQWKLTPTNSYCERRSPLAHITQQPAVFDFPRESRPRNFHYTGPFFDAESGDDTGFPFDRLDGRPLIYASMGTINNRLYHLFPMFMQACEGLDAQVVLSLGKKGQTIPFEIPGDCKVVSYAPQRELLKRASLVITHAGLNTVLEALTYGVPMTAIPVTGDQPGVGARIAYLGVGESIPLAELTLERLKTTVHRVWNGTSYRERARQVREEIARTNGLELAADIVEQALSTGKPVWHDDGVGAPDRGPQAWSNSRLSSTETAALHES